MKKIPKNFWDYEMGAEMISTVDAWNVYLEEKDYDRSAAMQTRWEAFQICFRYMFGQEVHFNRTDTAYGIMDENYNWIYKAYRKWFKK